MISKHVRNEKRWLFGFFFSSRRRHTRLTCDWSSDVCSSDLLEQPDATWTGRIQEMRCGNQGLTIVIVNLVATAAIAGVAAFYSAALMPVAALGSVVILPSIALFGPKDYLRYLPVPLQLGVEHVVSLLLVKV